eukprot:5479781-Prymnesium_polylepis.1
MGQTFVQLRLVVQAESALEYVHMGEQPAHAHTHTRSGGRRAQDSVRTRATCPPLGSALRTRGLNQAHRSHAQR